MSTSSAIEWTDVTWNPVRGCARVSTGCEHCYAERVAYRFGQKPGSPYEGLTVLGKHGPAWIGRARFVSEMLGEPLRWKKPRRVFVNSMSDLFHVDISFEEIAAVFGVMASTPAHTYQILTKRPARMLRWFEWLQADTELPDAPPAPVACGIHAANECADVDYLGLPATWPLPNVWLGVSCEDQAAAASRIPLLRRCPAAVHFVSAEPLLGELDLDRWLEWTPVGPDADGESHLLPPLRWVIVGGESGPRARACDTNWIRDVVRQCARASVPCFVKQIGAHLKTDLASVRFPGKGNALEDMPPDLRVRQWPQEVSPA